MKLCSYFLLSALHIHYTQTKKRTHTHTHTHIYKWVKPAALDNIVTLSLSLSHTHTHTHTHICNHSCSNIHRWIQQRAPTWGTDNPDRCERIHTHTHTHTHTLPHKNQLRLLYPTNLGDQRLINKFSILEEVTEQRNADMDSRQYCISLYHDPLVFAAQLW